MHDVLLVYPNMPEEEGSYGQQMLPLGLAWIAAWLEKHGCSVRILDLQVEHADVGEVVASEKPRVVGISGTTESRFISIDIARRAKQADPGVCTVYGGPHASFAAEDILDHVPEIDAVAIGEGEQTMLELVRVIQGGSRDLAAVPGLAVRQNGKAAFTPFRERMTDLDILPLPARHLLDMRRYTLTMDHLGTPGDQIVTSRGCPINCSFCSASAFWGKRYTMRSAANVMAEIDQVTGTYGAQGLKFFDSTLTLNRRHIDTLCAALVQAGRNTLPWECEIRADTVDRDLLRRMKEAGCYYVDMGMESASDRVLKSINKRVTVEQVERVLGWTEELGLKVKLFLTWGHPGETTDDMLKTLAFARKWRGRVAEISGPRPIRIYPGTAVERYAREIGCLPAGFSWCDPFADERGREYHVCPNVPILIQPAVGWEEFRRMKLKHYVGKQFSPSRLLRTVGKVRSMDDIRRHLRTLKDFISK